MIPISAGLVGFGYIYLDQARTARRTGVTSFFCQWPDDFEREGQPWQFYFALCFYTSLAYVLMAVGSILLIVSLFQTARKIGHAVASHFA